MIGAVLGHYRVLEKLGEGGMGVVYKAHDLHLDRSVALKVLPPEKVADPDRKRRFVQEAKAASALNHPHIVHIYDIDQSDGTDFIAMEYVEGQTLDARIGRHGMRLAEALKYAVQIADALTKAHAAGIVHRDLKPTNIMVSADGVVKVLDFGLAKLTEPELGNEAATATVGADGKPLTEAGVIVGTVAYMSPEQVEGKAVDARSDIFSLGSVLYQLLTGQQPFQGPSALSTLSAILQQEPKPASAIVPAIPHDLDKLINRCLRKDPTRRFQHMDDVKIALEELKQDSDSRKLAAVPATERKRPWRWLWAAAAAAAVLLAATLLVWQFRRVPPRDDLTAAPLTTYSGVESQPSFSPDGNKVAFLWDGDKAGNWGIYVMQIGSAAPPRPLTTSVGEVSYPAWSPDDRWIAFVRNQPDQGNVAVLLIPPLGGPERRLAEMNLVTGQGWTPDGKWLVLGGRDSTQERLGIWAISPETGERRRLTTIVGIAGRVGETYYDLGDAFPSVSADGRALAFVRGESDYNSDLYVLPLTADVRPAGEPVQLTDRHYGYVSGLAWTATDREIVYAAGASSASGLWRVSVSGRQTPTRLTCAAPDAVFPAIAPKTSRLAYTWRIVSRNLWRQDTRTGERRILVSSTYASDIPQYSPDGRKIAFQSNRTGSLEAWTCDADGSDCLPLTSFGGPQCGTPRWSPDSRWIAMDSRVTGTSEIYVIAADGGTPRRVTTPAAGESHYVPSWSPDGRWLYFASHRSGDREIWKIPVAGGEGQQVTRAGGVSALSSPDGRYIYYVKGPYTPGVFRMLADGGEEQQVVPWPVTWDSFAVTAKGVYFVTGPTIRFLDTASGKVRAVADVPDSAFGLCVSPDDAYIVWSQTDRSTTDLVVVEGFR